MCGIAGFIDFKSRWKNRTLETIAWEMASTIAHRGPDDEGTWVDQENGIALGHRRLSIIDLSSAGHQPMVSESGRHVIIYNGEVYNFGNLRKNLRSMGHRFRGNSDTEVVLKAIEQWGLSEAVKKFNGMFAFALWDRFEKRLHLVRDRVGIKPVFYGWMDSVFLFGSELKAFRTHPCWNGDIDRDALALFMRRSYIPSPYSIYKNVYKLFPGCILSVDGEKWPGKSNFNPLPANEGSSIHALQPRSYWSIPNIAEEGLNNPFMGSEDEGICHLQKLLTCAVSSRMISDVPVGAFLSGGIDSSLVVALMQSCSVEPVKTFSIGFHDAEYDEAEYAREVAYYLGTDHTELYVSPDEALKVIPELPKLYDEPFADSSQIPTLMVSELAGKMVKVSLSGDGGDENFGGYNQYFMATSIWNKTRWLSPSMRQLVAKGIGSVPLNSWEKLIYYSNRLFSKELRSRISGDVLYKAVDMIVAKTPDILFRTLTSHWKQVEDLVVGVTSVPTEQFDILGACGRYDFARRMMFSDLITYLPDDILVKLDRSSMGVGLEARVPILDHKVVEFVARLPLSMLIRGNIRKYALKRVLYKYVPMNLIERPKKGFSLPLGNWLRGPLKDWVESLLNESRLRREGYLNPKIINTKMVEHFSGERDWKSQLWNVLMFQSWLEG